MDHRIIANRYKTTWECQSYEAWVAAYGTPAQAAKNLVKNPQRKIEKFLPYLANIENQKIANRLGSHGGLHQDVSQTTFVESG